MALDLIVHRNKCYVPSMFHAAQETSMIINALRYKENEIQHQRYLAMNRMADKKPLYCNALPHLPHHPNPVCIPLIRVYPSIDNHADSDKEALSSPLSHTDTLSPKSSKSFNEHHVPVESILQTKNYNKKTKRKISKRKAIITAEAAIHLRELESKLINNNSSSSKPRNSNANRRH